MQSPKYHIPLMQPHQIAKDVIFNESLVTIDCFLNSAIDDFIKLPPETISIHEKYIIETGEKQNCICYLRYENSTIEFLQPFIGMIFFVKSISNFFIFNGSNWQPTSISISDSASFNDYKNKAETISEPAQDLKFTPIAEYHSLPIGLNYHYLYLDADTELSIDAINAPQITVIIKQNYQKSYQLKWPENILWQNKKPHQITPEPNSMDIVRVHKLLETNHFLGEILGTNYQW